MRGYFSTSNSEIETMAKNAFREWERRGKKEVDFNPSVRIGMKQFCGLGRYRRKEFIRVSKAVRKKTREIDKEESREKSNSTLTTPAKTEESRVEQIALF